MENIYKQFNLYPSWLSTKTSKKVDLDYLLNHIKNGDENRVRIEEARRIGKGNAGYQETKSTVPIVIWNTTFSNLKTKEDVTGMTGLVFFDKDNISHDEITSYKEHLMSFPYVLAVWVSFGGCGIGCLVKCEDITQGNFADVWDQIDEAIGISFDPGVRKATQVNALSYDPDIRINLLASNFSYDESLKKNVSTTVSSDKVNYVSSISTEENQWNFSTSNTSGIFNNIKAINLNYLSELTTTFSYLFEKSKIVFETQYDESLYEEKGYIEFETPSEHYKVNSRYYIPEGRRNKCLTGLLATFLYLNPRADKPLLYDYFKRINESQCRPPYPAEQLKSTFESFYRRLKNGKLYAKPTLRYLHYHKDCKLSTQERLKKNGEVGSRVRQSNTMKAMELAIDDCKHKGSKITKKLIAASAKRTAKTIAKHWEVFKEDITIHNRQICKYQKNNNRAK